MFFFYQIDLSRKKIENCAKHGGVGNFNSINYCYLAVSEQKKVDANVPFSF